ncbi:MAG: hypothetical protein AB1505_29730 [Candidatus Latescibacterota bacterium]
MELRREDTAARAWYGGKVPPAAQTLAAAEAVDPAPQVLYDHQAGQGEYAVLLRGIYDRMDSLKRSPLDFRTWAAEDGMSAFLQVLQDFAPADLRSRVQALQRLGGFLFRKSEGPEERKARVSGVFAAPQGEEDYRTVLLGQARRLAAVWAPRPDSVLDYVISRPAQMGRLIAERLSPTAGGRLRLVGHPFAEVRRVALVPFSESKTVAWERDGEIHLVTAVRQVLEKWDQDAIMAGGCANVTLLEALLLHEVVEVILHETETALEPLECHMVASTFERYLKGETLNVAVEDFFLEWPPPSAQEVAEQQEREMAEQLREINEYLAEQQAPELVEESLDQLPVDAAGRSLPRKVKVKKVVVRTKDGKTKIVKRRVLPGER